MGALYLAKWFYPEKFADIDPQAVHQEYIDTFWLGVICFGKNEVSCSVQKDAGDDPDVTHGLHIHTSACEIKQGICIRGGQGVGVVTKTRRECWQSIK